MQFPSDTALAAAVDSADRVITHSLTVDWPGEGTWDLTPWVQEVSCNRTLQTDLPTEATRAEGFAAAELSATLGGIRPSDGLSAVDVLSPYRTTTGTQPLLTAPIRWEVGFAGTTQVRQFTGTVRSVDSDSRSGRVQIKALDLIDTLRAPITLPAYAMTRSDILHSNHRFWVNTQGVVDYILRKNGIYASPPAHPDAQISCTGHGILAAERGRNAVPRGVAHQITDLSWFVPGPFGMLAVRGEWDDNGAYQEFFSREPYYPVAGNGIGVGAWIYYGSPSGHTAGGVRPLFQMMPLEDHEAWKFELNINATPALGGVIDVGGVDSGFAQPIATAPAWMYVGLHFEHMDNGLTKIRYRQNGVTSSGDVTTPLLTSGIAPRLQMTAWTYVPWCNMHVWYDSSPPVGDWPGEVHTSQASIDQGINEMYYLPDVLGEDSLAVLKEAVGAEYGLVDVDELGAISFRNRNTAIDPTTVDKTVTADRALLDFASEVSVDSIRNVIAFEATAASMTFSDPIVNSRGVLDWQSPVGVWTYDVALPHGAIGTTSQVLPRIASASWTDDQVWGFVSVQSAAPTVEITAGVSVIFTMIDDRVGRLTVKNYSPFPVRFATTSGQPALRVVGWNLVKEPTAIEEIRSVGSIAQYGGERVYKVPASEWRQLNLPLQVVAGGLRSALSNPTPLVRSVSIAGDPRLQLADCARFLDPEGQGSLRAYVVGITQSLDSNGFASSLDVRPVAPPGLGISDDTELGLADSTLIAAP